MSTRIAVLIALALLACAIGPAPARQRELRPSDLADAFVEAYNAHDADRLCALLATDVTVTAPDTSQAKGVEAQKRYYAAWFRSVPDVKVTVKTLALDANQFVLELKETGTYTKRLPTPGSPRARHQKLSYPWVLIGAVKDGAIQSVRIYENDLLLEKQLGMR